MTNAFEILFWLSFITLLYAHVGFPLLLIVVARFKERKVAAKSILPTVSIIISAYNEERIIEKKIANCLELDYPHDRVEIIVVSDGSTDQTNTILERIEVPNLRKYFMPESCGKTACQNKAVKEARNEILFFTDATAMHPPETLKLLVRNLHDPSVGCVTGKPIFRLGHDLTSQGLGQREDYEMYLRDKLGRISTLFGAQDCIYAIPRKLYDEVRPDLDSGFVGPLQILEKGYRTVYEPEALAFIDRAAPKVKDEFIRRSRIVLRGMRGLLHMKQLMNPFRHGFIALSLISSRLLRWLTPVFLAGVFLFNLFLLDSTFYLSLFLAQVVFYSIASVAFLLEMNGYRLASFLSIPVYFCILVCSATVGLKNLLAGETGQTWQTRR